MKICVLLIAYYQCIRIDHQNLETFLEDILYDKGWKVELFSVLIQIILTSFLFRSSFFPNPFRLFSGSSLFLFRFFFFSFIWTMNNWVCKFVVDLKKKKKKKKFGCITRFWWTVCVFFWNEKSPQWFIAPPPLLLQKKNCSFSHFKMCPEVFLSGLSKFIYFDIWFFFFLDNFTNWFSFFLLLLLVPLFSLPFFRRHFFFQFIDNFNALLEFLQIN